MIAGGISTETLLLMAVGIIGGFLTVIMIPWAVWVTTQLYALREQFAIFKKERQILDRMEKHFPPG